jgi:predicted RNase H-like nuclease (RuvC/YqgF family)
MTTTNKTTRAEVMALMANGAEVDDTALEQALSEATEQETAPESAQGHSPEKGQGEPSEQEVSDTDVAGFLAELRSLERANAKLEVQVENLTAQIDSHKTDTNTACGVIRKCVERLALPLETTVVGLETMSLPGLCNVFTQLNEKFEQRFKVGGVARTVKTEELAGASDLELRRRMSASKQTKRA